MKTGVLTVGEQADVLADPAWFTTGIWEPARGLLFRARIRPGAALIIRTSGVHTWGMTYPLDLILVDRHWSVLSVYESWAPWRIGPQHRRARYVVEMAPGSLAVHAVAPGMHLQWDELQGVEVSWTAPLGERAERQDAT